MNGDVLAVRNRNNCNTSDDLKKFIKSFLKKGSNIKKFEKEVEILRSLKHVNVISFEGTNETETKLEIIMEFCPNGALEKVIYDPKWLYSMHTVIWWSRQLFEALAYLAEQKVLHDDIRPQKFLLLADDFTLKIGEFGSASRLTGSLSKRMSKSDIYSAAMVIVVLDNRRPPTRNEKTNEELLTIKDEKLNTLVNKCLQQNPNDRPSVQECIGLLEELLKKFEKNESFERLPKRQLESQPTVNDFRDKLDASKVTIDRLLENFFDRLLENKLQLSNSNLVRENTLPNRFNKQQQRDHTSREQISLLLESLLLFSMCADIKIWPLFIEIANRCLRKLAYLIKIFTRPFYLKVFMNTTTLEEWYYLKEIPIKGHKHQWKQHIFLKKDTLQGKLLVGALVDEESQLTVFDPRTEIEQHKMQFLAFEVITPEWVLERIKSLHFKRDAIIHMMVQTAQSTPVFSDEKLRAHLTTGFEEEFTDIYQTNDRKESILAMRVRFLTIPRSVLLTYYGWSLKELPVYQKFYHRIGLLNVMNKKSLQPLYRTLSLEDFEKDIETKFSSTHLDFYVWNRGNEPKVFLLEPPRCINGFKKTVKGFTKKYNFTEVNLEKNSQKQFTQETVDLTVFEKTFTARLSAIKGNIKKSITHVK